MAAAAAVPTVAELAVTAVLLEFFIRRESRVELTREPLSHFCQEEVVLAAQDLLEKLNRQVITYQDIRDTAENLIGLHDLAYKKAPDIAKELGENVRKLTIIVGELATSLEKVSDVAPTDWMAVGDTIASKTERLNMAEIAPFWTYIPKMKDFLSIKLLGAGGFGAVYKAAYRPTNLICTIKLVACDRFQRHKQACIDKVVASVISSPFLVKYYACYSTREAYITIMEYICGADLMRVVDKAVYLPTEECRIVMAQLVLALEHMHLRGLLHRDIKVSNMLIIPGGRVKVIDFDTNKVCIGHFSKRVCKGYFSKTAFEFHDGESAGTVPYMAPEILRRRPYGRACDWWSAGATMYKMMTGRVPFRGETKEELTDRIINQPLKWPKVEEHPNSATPEAKDMVFRLLKKNPAERLGSATYAELKGHNFFKNFNWKRLSSTKDLCNIPAIGECMTRKKEPGRPDRLTVSATSNTRKRKLLKVEEMVDVDPQTQKPLYTYSSPSFKRMINFAKKQTGPVELRESFFETSAVESDELDYRNASDMDVNVGISAYGAASADKSIMAKERMDVILFRTKSLGKYWSFGIDIVEVMGENRRFVMVERVKSGSPAEASHVLEGGRHRGGERARHRPSAHRRARSGCSSHGATGTRSSRPAGQDTLQLRPIRTACGGSGNFGFKLFEAKAWNEQRKTFVHCHVVQKVMDVRVVTANKRLYPGDVLLMLDGVPVDTMDQYGLRAALAKAVNELTVTIAPMSPLRLRRPSYTRLHETVVTNAPEPSAKANIQAAPPLNR
ncbi:hypothetical protein MTO96_047734 [Rhipicephalus appendiculatus]